jgi:hypothetical protein
VDVLDPDRRPYRDGFRYGPEPGEPEQTRDWYAGTTPPTHDASPDPTNPWYTGTTPPTHDASPDPTNPWYTGTTPTVGGGEGGEPADPGPRDGAGELLGGEVLESGPERPPGESDLARLVTDARRWWRGTGVAGPWRRRAAAAAAAVAAAGAIVALRAGAPGVPLEETATAADANSGPVIIYGRARMQPPPFDRLPGRTPIPAPSPLGRPAEAVRGHLPRTGPTPGEESARAATRLVLGRYCRYPRAYLILLESARGWREVTATVLRWAYTESRRLTTVRLHWTDDAYVWHGRPSELARCA